jgi:CHASE2 domain-containing sensor protein
VSASVRRDVVILACAISAGIHGALVPAHLDESAAAGWAFAVSAAILAVLAIALTRRPEARTPLVLAAATLAGLLAAYMLAVTTGLPLLHPEPESVDGLAVGTKAIEAVGLIAAFLRGERAVALATPQTKGI